MPATTDDIKQFVAAALSGVAPPPPGLFRDPERAASNLRMIAGAAPPRAGTKLHLLVQHAADSFDADLALDNLERIIARSSDPPKTLRAILAAREQLGLLFATLSGSQYLSDTLARHPEWAAWLLQPAQYAASRSFPEYQRAARKVVSSKVPADDKHAELCRMRHRETLRIGARDLAGLATTEETAREISDLAQAIITAAAHLAWDETVARFGKPMVESGFQASRPAGICVLGMGKLGGRELNFSSDIDLVFVYEAEGETTGKTADRKSVQVRTNHEFFTRMGETLVRFLGSRGPGGNLYRVDMRLRPEGETGPLARSFDSFLSYLREQARDWERIAYLKARVMYGPSHLAERLYSVIEGFVFSDVDPARIVAEVERLKIMIDREVMEGELYHREVKRGYGGIREIEFVVAAMQIIYGAGHPALRVRNCYLAIQRLREVDLLPEEDATFYLESYEFLRRLEHRLQMAEERQTHTLPEDEAALELTARRAGFPAATQLLHHYHAVADGVHRRFVDFFKHDIETASRQSRDMLLLLDRTAPDEAVEEILAWYGMNFPGARTLLHGLAYGTSEEFVSAESQRHFEQMLPSLLRLAAGAPAPERVLPRFHSFVQAIKGMTYYYELISRHPAILRLLVQLFGTSEHFSRILIAHPEFFDPLLASQILYETADQETVGLRISNSLRASRNFDKQLVLLRRAVSFEILLGALRFILEIRPLPLTLRDLSCIADASLHAAMPLAVKKAAEALGPSLDDPARANLAATLGEMATRDFAVLALGKYGGRELSFFSDLDVVFVYDDSDAKWPATLPPQNETFAALADAIRHALGENLQDGRAFELDARLRPHGRNAPIATAASEYVRYLSGEADVWELLSFTRARVAWGQGDILHPLAEAANARRANWTKPAIRRAGADMRRQLEDAVSGGADFKRGPGGLVDIEFSLQIGQLCQKENPFGDSGDYFSRLAALRSGKGRHARHYADLALGYLFLRSVEIAVRLVGGASAAVLPADNEDLAAVARFLELENPAALLERLESIREANRAAYLAVIQA